MVTITFDDLQITVPQSWSDIKLGDYQKWFMQEPRNRIEQVELVASICNLDVNLLLDNPVQIFDTIYDIVKFAFDEFNETPANSIVMDGKKYMISSTDELTLAEWVDLEATFTDDSSTRLSGILSILCRPIGESYDSKLSDTRKELFCNLTMDKALPLLAFFLQRRERYLIVSNLYSQALQQGKQYLRLMQNFVENGDGIKSLPIWQRIKYYFLMKYYKRRLLKFSGFFSTESTNFMQNLN